MNTYATKIHIADYTKGKYFIVLFLIWPFLAFIAALANYDHRESRRILYVFLIYYGLTFVIANQGVDAFRYALQLKENASLPFSEFFNIVGNLYSTSSSVDFIEPLLSFIVSRFTTQHNLLFAVYAALFGYFYLRSVNLLYHQYKVNTDWNTMIFMVFFIVILPVTQINGFRMWAAAWIFFWGSWHVIVRRDFRYLFVALISAFVHWSFLIPGAILLAYYFAGNRNAIYIPLAIVSFVIPTIIGPVLQSVATGMGGAIQGRYEGYTSEAYMEARAQAIEQVSWFVQLGNNLIYYYLIFAVIFIQIFRRQKMMQQQDRNMFSFMLLFITLVNFGSQIPSFGNRFQVVFLLYGTYYIFRYFIHLAEKKINLLTWIGLFPMVLYAALQFRMSSVSINLWLFTPGFGLPLFAPGISVGDLMF